MRSHRIKIHRAKFALFVLLALQLVIGLQLPAPDAVAAIAGASSATTTAAAAGAAATATAQHACQTQARHVANDAVALVVGDAAARPVLARDRTRTDGPVLVRNHAGTGDTAVAGDHGPTSDHAPASGHTCCHTGTCQCHCLNPPAAIASPLFADLATSVAIPSLPAAQFYGPRIDEFLRPPIA